MPRYFAWHMTSMRFVPALGLAVTLLFHGDLPVALGQQKVERDWTKYPAIVQIDTGEDILVVGDVHGDYNHLVRALQAANIIARQPGRADEVNWIAGKAVVVFMGDMIDKGTHSLKVLTLVRALRDAAIHQGGQVIVLLGNHEARFLADPSNEKAQAFRQGTPRSEPRGCGRGCVPWRFGAVSVLPALCRAGAGLVLLARRQY